jgi:hypothetical protein
MAQPTQSFELATANYHRRRRPKYGPFEPIRISAHEGPFHYLLCTLVLFPFSFLTIIPIIFSSSSNQPFIHSFRMPHFFLLFRNEMFPKPQSPFKAIRIFFFFSSCLM